MIISRLVRGYRSRRRVSVALLNSEGGTGDHAGGDPEGFHQSMDGSQQLFVGPAAVRIIESQDTVVLFQIIDIREPELLTAQAAHEQGQDPGSVSAEEITEPVAADLRFFVSMCLQERFQSLFIRSHCMYLRIRTLSVPEKPDHFLNFPQIKSQCRQEH